MANGITVIIVGRLGRLRCVTMNASSCHAGIRQLIMPTQHYIFRLETLLRQGLSALDLVMTSRGGGDGQGSRSEGGAGEMDSSRLSQPCAPHHPSVHLSHVSQAWQAYSPPWTFYLFES